MQIIIFSSIWVLGTAAFFVMTLKKRLGIFILPSIIVGAFILYLSAFINSIKVGYYLSYLFVFSFFVILIKCIVKKDKEELDCFKNNFVTPELIIYVLFVVYFYFLYRYKGFEFCDEFTHWGQMVKETIKYNGFYSQSTNRFLRHKDYPPFFTLLETLWCMFGGKFSETYCYMAMSNFMLSLFMPLYTKLELKKIKDDIKGLILALSSIFVLLCISATPTASDLAHVFNSIYVDWAMAGFVAYSFFLIVTNEEYDKVTLGLLSICCSVTLLSKQMGIAFYMLFLLMFYLKSWIVDKKLNKKLILKSILLLIVIPGIFYLSWKMVINYYDVAAGGQFSVGQIKITDTISILKGYTGNEWQREAFRQFIPAMFARPLCMHPFEVSYVVSIVIIFVLINLLYRNIKGIIVSIVYSFGSIAYAGSMLLLYMFSFSSEEASSLASFDRYMMTYVFIGIVLLFMLVVNFILDKNKNSILFLVIVLLSTLAIAEKNDIKDIVPSTSIRDSYDYNVLVIQNKDTDFYVSRENLNGLRYRFEEVDNEDLITMNKEDFISFIKDYQIIFIQNYSQDLYENLWKECTDVDYYENCTYQIKEDGNKINYIELSFIARVIRYYMY